MKPILFALIASVSPLFGAVNLPYTNDFGSSVTDFTTGGLAASTWTRNGGLYTNSIPTDGASHAMVQVTGLGAGTKQSFSVSTVVTAFSASSGSVGFGVLSTGGNLGNSSFILADLFQGGVLRFRPFTNGNAVGSDVSISTAIRPLEIATLGEIMLSVTGVYNGDDSLTLTLTAVQGSTTVTHSTTYASGTYTDGSWFGYRDRNNTGSTNVTATNISHDSLTIEAIPEPSAVLLSGMLTGLACLRRRR